MMSIRFLFSLMDADGCRSFSFDHSDDHYRLEVLSYMVSFSFLLCSTMTTGVGILASGQRCAPAPWVFFYCHTIL